MNNIIESYFIRLHLNEERSKKLQRITKIMQSGREKWHDYLNDLQQPIIYRFQKDQILKDLVLLIEHNLPTYKWLWVKLHSVFW